VTTLLCIEFLFFGYNHYLFDNLIATYSCSSLMMSSQLIYLTSVRMFSVDYEKSMDAKYVYFYYYILHYFFLDFGKGIFQLWFRIVGTISVTIVSIYHSTRLLVHSRFLFISWLKTVEIVIPELHEMRIAHIVSIGSESLYIHTESRLWWWVHNFALNILVLHMSSY